MGLVQLSSRNLSFDTLLYLLRSFGKISQVVLDVAVIEFQYLAVDLSRSRLLISSVLFRERLPDDALISLFRSFSGVSEAHIIGITSFETLSMILSHACSSLKHLYITYSNMSQSMNTYLENRLHARYPMVKVSIHSKRG
jgi:hypothetical protein